MIRSRKRIPVQKITAAVGAIKSGLESAKNQAGEGIPRVAHSREIAPGAGGIAGMHADPVSMDASGRFADRFLSRFAAQIAKHKLVGCERNRFAYSRWRKALG